MLPCDLCEVRGGSPRAHHLPRQRQSKVTGKVGVSALDAYPRSPSPRSTLARRPLGQCIPRGARAPGRERSRTKAARQRAHVTARGAHCGALRARGLAPALILDQRRVEAAATPCPEGPRRPARARPRRRVPRCAEWLAKQHQIMRLTILESRFWSMSGSRVGRGCGKCA